ncbi:hypothetical protein EBR44_13915, partial [bacterium]|nr:hypothetical protein [bacterium]
MLALSSAAFAAIATASAQNAPPVASNAANASGNPLAAMPFGAANDKPVSKWTPPASAGRQLTLNDMLTWKGIRSPALSNDGKWFAYTIAPNEGDADVVIRPTSAGGKEWRFPVGDATGGGGRGGAGGVGISGNNKWAAFLVNPSGAAAGRGGRGGRGG